MADLKHDVINSKGETVGSIDLNPDVFGAPVKKDIVHTVVRWQRAKKRAGTHATLNRAKMTGGGKKPWRQKGTGNARAGSSNSPLWRGGAVTFGPTPRSYEFKVPRKVRQQAMTSVLSDMVKKERLLVLDNLSVESGKTKDMTDILKAVGIDKSKAVILMPEKDELVWRSSRNIKGVQSLPVAGANVYDIVNAQYLVGTKDAIEALQNRFANKE